MLQNKKHESSGEDGHVNALEEEENRESGKPFSNDLGNIETVEFHHSVEKKVKLSVKLSKCVNYIESVRFTGFDTKG